MLALNRTTIDFFSLDVEGAELQVLQTIDFSKLNIRTLTVEYEHVKAGKQGLTSFLTRHGGMKLHKTIAPLKDMAWAKDLFFINSQITEPPVARSQQPST